MSNNSGNFTIAALVFSVLLAITGISFSARWMASSDMDRIRMIQENKDLTASQKSILVSMIALQRKDSEQDRLAIADYCQRISFRLFDIQREEIKRNNPRVHILERAGNSFSEVSEELKSPNFNSERVGLELVRAFTFLESAKVTTEELDISKPPSINTNASDPESIKGDSGFPWSAIILAILGVIGALLAGFKAWYDYRKAQLELKKVQTEMDKALIEPANPNPST